MKPNPGNEQALLEKGISLGSLGRHEQAIECYDSVLQLAPQSLWANNNKGWSLENLGRLQEAISFYDSAIGIDASEFIPWQNKLLVLAKAGKFTEMEGCFESARGVVSDQRNLLLLMGNIVADMLHDYTRAITIYRELVERDATDYLGKANLAEALVKGGKYSEARLYAADVVKGSTDSQLKQVGRYIIFASYALEGIPSARAEEFANIAPFFENIQLANTEVGTWRFTDKPLENTTQGVWSFKELLEIIAKSTATPEAKFLLLTVLDLYIGKIRPESLSFFNAQNAQAVDTGDKQAEAVLGAAQSVTV